MSASPFFLSLFSSSLFSQIVENAGSEPARADDAAEEPAAEDNGETAPSAREEIIIVEEAQA